MFNLVISLGLFWFYLPYLLIESLLAYGNSQIEEFYRVIGFALTCEVLSGHCLLLFEQELQLWIWLWSRRFNRCHSGDDFLVLVLVAKIFLSWDVSLVSYGLDPFRMLFE